jgi:hypothetical protein
MAITPEISLGSVKSAMTLAALWVPWVPLVLYAQDRR